MVVNIATRVGSAAGMVALVGYPLGASAARPLVSHPRWAGTTRAERQIAREGRPGDGEAAAFVKALHRMRAENPP